MTVNVSTVQKCVNRQLTMSHPATALLRGAVGTLGVLAAVDDPVERGRLMARIRIRLR
jgi:hypothetical protein